MPEALPDAVATLKTLLTAQHLAVLATQQNGRPYTSLVAFVASEDLRSIAFLTSRAFHECRAIPPRPFAAVDGYLGIVRCGGSQGDS